MVHRISLLIGKLLITGGIVLMLSGAAHVFVILALLMGGLLALASHGLNLVHACERGTERLRLRIRPHRHDLLFLTSFFLVNTLLWSTITVQVSLATRQFLLALFLAMVAAALMGARHELCDEELTPG